ncbi:unnamed protein product [Prorocentrum cordatum]|uniref:Transmembrane protein n=1 Tax=Prorocentrum cordatum TaxID=2364126 RepID=A0ABN9TE51_9DINO|nr:unnamed protein product [Polarella glacialis]
MSRPPQLIEGACAESPPSPAFWKRLRVVGRRLFVCSVAGAAVSAVCLPYQFSYARCTMMGSLCNSDIPPSLPLLLLEGFSRSRAQRFSGAVRLTAGEARSAPYSAGLGPISLLSATLLA